MAQKQNTRFVIYATTFGGKEKINSFNTEKEAEEFVDSYEKKPDKHTAISIENEAIITPIPNYYIGQDVNVMFRKTKYVECEYCGHGIMDNGEKEKTPGVIKDIRIENHGISYGVDGLDKIYPETTYLFQEKDIL